jgi:hypothetical protein
MRNELLEVDGLILEVADYKNNYADVAAEKLLRRCSTSWPGLYLTVQDMLSCVLQAT